MSILKMRWKGKLIKYICAENSEIEIAAVFDICKLTSLSES